MLVIEKYQNEIKEILAGTTSVVGAMSKINNDVKQVLELKQEFEKCELISLGVPKVVTDHVSNVVKPRKDKSKKLEVSHRAYSDGVSACDKYHGK